MTDKGLPTTLVQSFKQSAACDLAARLVRLNQEFTLKLSLRATLPLYAASKMRRTVLVSLSGLEGLAAAGEQTVLNAVAGDFRARINACLLPDIVLMN